MVTCKEFAQHVKNLVRVSIECETSVRRDRPSLAIISVGDDPASAAYVRGKIKDCEEVGIAPVHIQLPADVSQGTLHSKIVEAHNCSGIIVQLPLPNHLSAAQALDMINPSQDVDGLTKGSQFTPCTAKGIYEWMRHNWDLHGKHAVIINRSPLVGRPLAKLLLDADMAVTVVHSKVPYGMILDLCKSADFVVVAVGKPNFIQARDCKIGTTIIDVGINRVDGKLCGDVGYDSAFTRRNVTPVPGGVGLLTRAFLMSNVLEAFKRGY